jgi:hypothetical protein
MKLTEPLAFDYSLASDQPARWTTSYILSRVRDLFTTSHQSQGSPDVFNGIPTSINNHWSDWSICRESSDIMVVIPRSCGQVTCIAIKLRNDVVEVKAGYSTELTWITIYETIIVGLPHGCWPLSDLCASPAEGSGGMQWDQHYVIVMGPLLRNHGIMGRKHNLVSNLAAKNMRGHDLWWYIDEVSQHHQPQLFIIELPKVIHSQICQRKIKWDVL